MLNSIIEDAVIENDVVDQLNKLEDLYSTAAFFVTFERALFLQQTGHDQDWKNNWQSSRWKTINKAESLVDSFLYSWLNFFQFDLPFVHTPQYKYMADFS